MVWAMLGQGVSPKNGSRSAGWHSVWEHIRSHHSRRVIWPLHVARDEVLFRNSNRQSSAKLTVRRLTSVILNRTARPVTDDTTKKLILALTHRSLRQLLTVTVADGTG